MITCVTCVTNASLKAKLLVPFFSTFLDSSSAFYLAFVHLLHNL